MGPTLRSGMNLSSSLYLVLGSQAGTTFIDPQCVVSTWFWSMDLDRCIRTASSPRRIKRGAGPESNHIVEPVQKHLSLDRGINSMYPFFFVHRLENLVRSLAYIESFQL